jgi:hypothetical protein
MPGGQGVGRRRVEMHNEPAQNLQCSRRSGGEAGVSPEPLEVDDTFADRDPLLAQLAATTVAGLPLAGPDERKREAVTTSWMTSGRDADLDRLHLV